jgi:hypothetical protein
MLLLDHLCIDLAFRSRYLFVENVELNRSDHGHTEQTRHDFFLALTSGSAPTCIKKYKIGVTR